MKTVVTLLIVAILAGGGSGKAFANPELAVIAHNDVTVDSATADQLRNLWLGSARTLPGTKRLKIVDQPKNSDLRLEFYSVIVGKSPGQARAHWAKLMFSGKAFPPKEMFSSPAIVNWVANTPNSIAYIELSAVNDSVKILLEL